jgi:hypothetical protein
VFDSLGAQNTTIARSRRAPERNTCVIDASQKKGSSHHQGFFEKNGGWRLRYRRQRRLRCASWRSARTRC